MQRDDIIMSISLALERDERVAGLFLSGSLGRGMADRFSDVDLLAVAPDADRLPPGYAGAAAGLRPRCGQAAVRSSGSARHDAARMANSATEPNARRVPD